MIKRNRAKDEKEEERKEENMTAEERKQRKLMRQLSKTDKYTELEEKLREKEIELIEKSQVVVAHHQKLLEQDKGYQINVRKTLAAQKGLGMMGELTGKGYTDLER